MRASVALACLGGAKIGFAQEPAKARYFSLFKAMCTRTFEECTLRADYKRKLSAPVRFDFTHLPDQFNHITPVNVTWKAPPRDFPEATHVCDQMRVHYSSFPYRNRERDSLFDATNELVSSC